jgi:hypothetical protein
VLQEFVFAVEVWGVGELFSRYWKGCLDVLSSHYDPAEYSKFDCTSFKVEGDDGFSRLYWKCRMAITSFQTVL